MTWTNVRIIIPGLKTVDVTWPGSQPLPVRDTFIVLRGEHHDRSFHVKDVINRVEQDSSGMWEFWLEVHG